MEERKRTLEPDELIDQNLISQYMSVHTGRGQLRPVTKHHHRHRAKTLSNLISTVQMINLWWKLIGNWHFLGFFTSPNRRGSFIIRLPRASRTFTPTLWVASRSIKFSVCLNSSQVALESSLICFICAAVVKRDRKRITIIESEPNRTWLKFDFNFAVNHSHWRSRRTIPISLSFDWSLIDFFRTVELT